MQAPERTIRPLPSSPGGHVRRDPRRPARAPASGPVTPAMAAYLGLPSDRIRAQLDRGLTLAEIAAAEGKTAGGLEDAVVDGARTHLDAAVAAGKLTPAQEAALLAAIHSHVASALGSPLPPRPGRRRVGGHRITN